jgi:hypothetical protein
MEWVSAGTKQSLDVGCAAYGGREENGKPTLLTEMDQKKVGCWIAVVSGSVAER